jgi:hypothetical protein
MVDLTPQREYEIARTLAAFLCGQRIVNSLWMQNNADALIFWILTEPTDPAEVQPLFDANQLLDERFPRARFHLNVLNPVLFADPAFSFAPPPGCERIEIRLP